MRLAVSYVLTKPVLPIEYRRGFASLIKEALKNSNSRLFSNYYATPHVLKPFTFSIYFPKLAGREGGQFNVGDQAILNFSTSSYELGTYVYNGLLTTRTFPLFENTLTLSQISLRGTTNITQDKIVFKTLAPILINTRESRDWYCLPGGDGFDEGLNFAVREVTREFLCMENVTFEFKPLKFKRKVIRHYNMDMQGFVSTFELSGASEVLNLIYQVGIGMRRSQGFGMLEVV